MARLSYWVMPLVAGIVWLGMLLGMLIYWNTVTDRVHYDSMNGTQTIAYISDVGADSLRPLFITGCCITAAFLAATFVADRYLRHRGRLVPNQSRGEKALALLAIIFAMIGSAGLVLLSVFDTNKHPSLHLVFLAVFIFGYAISAIFICWEYQRLGIKYRDHRLLRISFWVKLVFVIVEITLCLAFLGLQGARRHNEAAILEWTISFVFTFYACSLFIDLYPAAFTKHGDPVPLDPLRQRKHGSSRLSQPVQGVPSEEYSSLDVAAAEEGHAAMREYNLGQVPMGQSPAVAAQRAQGLDPTRPAGRPNF